MCLTPLDMADWRPGETLLLSGKLLTGRDAAHKRPVDMLELGDPLPIVLEGRAVYYVGPVDPVGDEIVGPAVPTTATQMDRFVGPILDQGLLAMIGKAERGPKAIAQIADHRATYLIAVGGAAVLVAKLSVRRRSSPLKTLTMEAIREFEVRDMPATVAVDSLGASIHTIGPAAWRGPAVAVPTP